MTWYREWFGEESLELDSYRDAGEARQQVEFFHEQFGAIQGPLLDLACGTGRDLGERWFDKSDRSLNKRITIGQEHFLERVRGYDLDEISVMFTSYDLAIRPAFGDFDGRPYDGDAPRVILVGGKGL